MASVDPRILDQIARARLQGRGPDAFGSQRNPDWPYSKMYEDVWDGTDLINEGDYDGYNMIPPPERKWMFGGPYAQYQGMPQAPDTASSRDLYLLNKNNSPAMRRRFEDYFGQQALDRNDAGVEQRDKNYIPSPRPRPSSAPIGPASDEYEGDESGMSPSTYGTRGQPRPEEVYDYMPGLKDRIQEHMLGPGIAREGKSDFADPKFSQAFDAFSDQPSGNIQDLRTMAIEQMMKRGAVLNAPPQQPDEADYGRNVDDLINDKIQEMQSDPAFQDYYRGRR